jgi:hypothetical protein
VKSLKLVELEAFCYRFEETDARESPEKISASLQGDGIAGPPVHMIAFQASHSSRSASRKPSVEATIREQRAKGDGIIKIARTLGVGTSVVLNSRKSNASARLELLLRQNNCIVNGHRAGYIV